MNCAAAVAAAVAAEAAVAEAAEVVVTAETLEIDAESDTALFTGGVTLVSGDLRLTADALDYDAPARRARARGRVRATQGVGLLEAAALTLQLPDGALVVERPRLRLGGRVPVRVWGERVERDARGEYRGEHLSLTPCDCPGERPPCWRVDAAAARVVPDDRADLDWPVLRVFELPVLALPALSVPLAERRSGLLLPRLFPWSPSGFVYEQPLFVTLGDAFDLTLTPGWATGTGDAPPPGSRGVKGPSVGLEVRWTPAERVEGRAALDWRYDLYAGRGHRGAFELRHRQRAEPLRINADAAAATDPGWFADTAPDLAARARAYTRSAVVATYGRPEAALWLEATVLQDLDLASAEPRMRILAPRESTLGLELPVARLVGPVRAGAAATASLRRQTAVLRLDAPLELAGVAVLVPEAVLRGALYDLRVARRYAWTGASARSELGRAFGSWRHTVTPELRWRLGWAGADPDAPDPRDELDAPLPEGGIHQVDAALSSVLSGPALTVTAEAGQGAELPLPGAAARWAVGWLLARAEWSWGRAEGELRGDVEAQRLAAARAAFALRDPRGDELRGAASSIAPGASDRIGAPLDALFRLAAPTASPAAATRVLTAGATLAFVEGLSARYDLLWIVDGPLQHAAVLKYDSPCGCAGASLSLNWISGEPVPRLGLLIDLRQLGSVAF